MQSNAAPTFVDLDNDNVLDLVVGCGARKDDYDFNINTNVVLNERNEYLSYFKNTGTPEAAVFTYQTCSNNPFNGIEMQPSLKAIASGGTNPNFADLDNDNDFDLIVGDDSGQILHFKNVGSSIKPNFVLQTGTDNLFNGLETTDYINAAPAFADIDHDGDVEVFIGVDVRLPEGNVVSKMVFLSRTRCNLNAQCSRQGKCVYSSFTSSTCKCTLSSGTHCESCEIGKIESLYEGGDGLQLSVAPKCRSCNAGTWSNFVGYSSTHDCTKCQPGRAFDDSVVLGTNITDCVMCNRGQYQSEAGKTVCLDCNPGKYGIYGGSFEIIKTTRIISYEIAGSFLYYYTTDCTGNSQASSAEIAQIEYACDNGNTFQGIPFVSGQCAQNGPQTSFIITCPSKPIYEEIKKSKNTKCIPCDKGEYQDTSGTTFCLGCDGK